MYSGKVVVVAGGSKGLGMAIAKAFSANGAIVVLLARSKERLESAATFLNSLGGVAETYFFSVDLTQGPQVEQVVLEIRKRHGQIDVWVNAVGQSIRTSFDDCSVQSYRDLMEQNFFTSVNGSLAVLESLAETGGSLVNIGSLASKTAWPFVAPYVTSKHALAGFVKQLRLEGPEQVHYLIVLPGPIHSDENKNRYADQTAGLPASAKKPGAGAPVKAIDPDWLAEKIVDCCRRRKTELVVPLKSRLLFIIG